MKKISSVVAVLTLLALLVPLAHVEGATVTSWELGINGGYDTFDIQSGFGGGLSGYYALGGGFQMGIMANAYSISHKTPSYPIVGVVVSSADSETIVEAMAAAKYKFNTGPDKPYVFAGVGIADVIASETASVTGSQSGASDTESTSQLNPMFALGAGWEFPLAPAFHLDIQAKESIVTIPSVSATAFYDQGPIPIYFSSSNISGFRGYTVVEVAVGWDL